MSGVWGFGFFLLSGLTGISLDTFVIQINFHPYWNSVKLMTSLTWRGKSVPQLNLCAKTCFYLLDLNSLPFSFEHPSALQDKNRPSPSTFVVLFDSKLFFLILFSNLSNTKFSLHSFPLSQRSTMTLHSILDEFIPSFYTMALESFLFLLPLVNIWIFASLFNNNHTLSR